MAVPSPRRGEFDRDGQAPSSARDLNSSACDIRIPLVIVAVITVSPDLSCGSVVAAAHATWCDVFGVW